jgi:hypothetical protein
MRPLRAREAYADNIVNGFLLRLQTPIPRLFTTPGFTELQAGVPGSSSINRVERLMGEVSKRCKHMWMHWSPKGLRNILTLIPVRYTDEALKEKTN